MSASGNDTTSGSYRIEPLKGAENYISWRIQIADVLNDLGLWEYVDETSTEPADATLALVWRKNDRKVLTVIRLWVTSEMMTYVLSATTSKAAYDALANVFNVQGGLAKVLARRKFLRYQIEEGASMEEEIRKIRKLKEELVLLGQTITDDEFSLTILTALPPTWDPFISSVGAVTVSSDLIGRILQEDTRRRERPSSDTSLVTTSRAVNQRGRRSKFRKGVYCHNCGREGHIRPECRSPKDNANAGQSRAHVVEEEPPAVPDEEYCFVTEDNLSFSLTSKGEVWLGDTASQSHIMRDKSLFTDYIDTPHGTIKGAGTCPALGKGTAQIVFITKTGRISIVLRDAIYAPEMPYNLISLGRLTSAGLSYMGSGDHLRILHGNRVIGVGAKHGNLYRITVAPRAIKALAI